MVEGGIGGRAGGPRSEPDSHPTQGSERAPSNSRLRWLVLLAAATVLVVFGAGPVCRSYQFDHGGGDYDGRTLLVAVPGGPPGVTNVVARTVGEELCPPTSVQEDWDVTFVIQQRTTVTDFIAISPYGTGGYATGILDCIFGQALVWTFEWDWTEGGISSDDRSAECWDFYGSICPF